MPNSSNVSLEAADLSGMEVEIMKVPVLSTAHVSEKTRDMLDFDNPQWVHHCAKYEFGWFIAVPTEEAEGCFEQKPSDDLAALFGWARKHGFGWLRLDSDGATVAELPTFDW